MNAAQHRTILAIDLGTQSLRVSALRTDGERLWNWSAPVASHVDGDIIEQSPARWAALLEEGLRTAHAAGISPDAITTAGPLAGYVPIDAEGTPLAPAVMYSDRRSAKDIVAMEALLGGALTTRVLVSDPLPHWLRLKRELPDVAARTVHFLDATGWLNHFLTGEATMNAYTAMRLLAPALRVRAEGADAPFGRAVALGETIGSLGGKVDPSFGWTGVPVIAATFDSKCAYIGSGIDQAGEATDISGTVTSFGVISTVCINDARQRIYSVPFGQKWLVRGSTACAGSALEWVRAHLLQQGFDDLDAAVSAVPPGANGLTFLPYLAGERAPLWDPHARGALLGLGLHSNRADMARAVYEGLALSLGHIAQTMAECSVEIREIRLAGGLARNDLLAQMKADILNVPVVRLADHELTTLGLAVIASVALAIHPDHARAAAQFVVLEHRFEPSPDAHARYAAARARYLACSNALTSTFHLYA